MASGYCSTGTKGPEKNNTEGLRSALARLRNRTGPTFPQPSPPGSPLPIHNNNPNSNNTSTATIITTSTTAATATASVTATSTAYGHSVHANGQQQNNENIPGSPIFREDRRTPPITSAPLQSTPKHRGKGNAISSGQGTSSGNSSAPKTQFHAMTVSVTHATQSGSTVVTTKPVVAPSCYTSTRSAAMMALALGQRPKSPTKTAISTTSTSTASSSATAGAGGTGGLDKHMKDVFVSDERKSSTTISNSVTNLKQSTQINGTFSGGSASSGSDNDGFNTSSSSSATALRRLYFKSGRKSKMNATATTSMTSLPMNAVKAAAAAYHASMGGMPAAASHTTAVPKVVIMGSSTASMTDATINTSTDSASTLVTSVTHTDTSETCDSLDLGDNSGQSEPLFSSLEEPLLTAIQIDSEHDGTEMELTSCTRYPRPDMHLQNSTESQESSLSILATEPTSSTPLLASHRRHNATTTEMANNKSSGNGKERLPKTAPAPTTAQKHFVFDPPKSPKSARTTEKTRNHFTFKDSNSSGNRSVSLSQQQQQEQQQQQQQQHLLKQTKRTFDMDKSRDERHHRGTSPSKCGKYNSNSSTQRNSNYYRPEQDEVGEDEEGDFDLRSKKLRSRDSSLSKSRNRYSTGGNGLPGNSTKTSPKREPRRSTSSSKVNSAPPTMKESNFFGSNSNVLGKVKAQQLSPSSQDVNAINQRKYSSSSSSGGSDRDRRERIKNGTMFPFDREAIDYERIQRECFAVDENSSSSSSSSETEDGEACSVYERRLSSRHGSPKSAVSADIFQQYTLLSKQEQQQQQQQQPHHAGNSGPPSRKNSKRIRPDSVMHATICENQQYVPKSDAFYPQPKTSTSPGEHTHTHTQQHSPKSYAELNKFEEIASKFDKIPPKHGSNANLSIIGNSNCNLNSMDDGGTAALSTSSPTGSMRSTTPPYLPNLRVDFFSESNPNPNANANVPLQSRKKSFKSKASSAAATAGDCPAKQLTSATRDILDESQQGAIAGGVSAAGTTAGAINVTANPMEAAVSTLPRATIVVQQPSLSLDNTVETVLIKSEGDFISVEQVRDMSAPNERGVIVDSGGGARKRNSQQLQHPPHFPAHTTSGGHHLHHQHHHHTHQKQKRDDNMRQLLDVTNTLTIEELRDFEMRYGSPHHCRSQSVKTPGSRASGRPNQLCLPQQRSRVASMPNTGVEEEYYRLRHFSITGKGIVNRGDSLKSRRSRSNNSVASSNSSTEHLTATQLPAPNSARTSATCSLASSRESSTSNPGNGPYRVLMLGGPAVGKSSLVSQFMTSEYLHAYDTSIDDDSGEKSVSVLLSGEESELIFIDHPFTEMKPDDCLANYDPHGYCVIYSAADRSSFNVAEHVLQVLWTNQNIAQKAVILVANKADLARSRLVTSEEGKAMATAYDCKFIETSVGINHNVDELLVGLLSQIRLKLENPEKSRDLFRKRSIRKSKRRACSPLSGACLTGGTNPNTPLGPANNVMTDPNTPPGSAHSSPRKYRGSRTSTSLKVKGLLGRVWARDSKSKSCENLHVL